MSAACASEAATAYTSSNGTGQTLIYDAGGRLAQVKDQNNVTVATYTYGASNHRLISQNADGSSIITSVMATR